MGKLTSVAIVILILVAAYAGKRYYLMPKFEAGEKAPDFQFTLHDGSQVSLSALRGKYVLLNFWGSWCGPCIREMPALNDLYKKFNGKKFKQADDFEIVGIAVEKSKDRWENTIKQLNLDWKYHYSDFNHFDSPIVKYYGVREIPSKYILDKTGQIIAVNPDVAELDQMLSQDLAQN